MTEQEMENEVEELVMDYCFYFGEPCDEILDFLIDKGNLYKIETLLNQVEKDEDYG
jgi:hypothetical protein